MEAHNLIWNWFEFVMIWFVIICDLNKSQVSVMAMLAGIVRYQINTRMWANAQRDGRPAKHRWRPLFNAAVWLTPTTRVPCSRPNAAKTRNPLKFAGVPQTRQTISAASGRKFNVLWGRVEEILLFKTFFSIVDKCLSCEDTARQSCVMVRRRRFLAIFCVLHFQRAACTTFQTCILKFALGQHNYV